MANATRKEPAFRMTESKTHQAEFGGNPTPSLSKRLLFTLALCAGAAVANLYYAQPLLALIGESFDALTKVGVIAMATQVGYPASVASTCQLPITTDRLETSSNTGNNLAHAREASREDLRTERQ